MVLQVALSVKATILIGRACVPGFSTHVLRYKISVTPGQQTGAVKQLQVPLVHIFAIHPPFWDIRSLLSNGLDPIFIRAQLCLSRASVCKPHIE